MNAESQRWIEAGKILAVDPSAKVVCPRCGDANLEVLDVVPPSDGTVRERHLKCPKCLAYNALRLRNST